MGIEDLHLAGSGPCTMPHPGTHDGGQVFAFIYSLQFLTPPIDSDGHEVFFSDNLDETFYLEKKDAVPVELLLVNS